MADAIHITRRAILKILGASSLAAPTALLSIRDAAAYPAAVGNKPTARFRGDGWYMLRSADARPPYPHYVSGSSLQGPDGALLHIRPHADNPSIESFEYFAPAWRVEEMLASAAVTPAIAT